MTSYDYLPHQLHRSFNVLLLIVLGFLIFFREPGLFLDPRLWAEEGSLYFQYAYHHPWYESLFIPHLGYYSLFTNLASVIAAKLINLEWVAYFLMLASLFVQLIPFGIIWWSKSSVWDKSWKKGIGMAIVLLTLLSGEVWLNTINSQFYLSLVTFLILLEDFPLSTLKKWTYRALLLVSGLTGMLSVFLLPVFLLSLAWINCKERRIQVGILMGTGILQGFVFLSRFTQDALFYSRFQGFEIELLPSIVLLRSFFLPFIGPHNSAWLQQEFLIPHAGSPVLFLGSLIVILAVLVGFSHLIQTKERVLYIGSYLSLICLSLVASLGETAEFFDSVHLAQRYFYVPNVILVLMLFRNTQMVYQKKLMMRCITSGLLLSLALMNGLIFYRYAMSYHYADPSWRDEVEQYRADPGYQLRIAPKGWEVDLS